MSADVEERFVADIQADPNNNSKREVYADWLEDNGKIVEANYLRLELLKKQAPFEWLIKMGRLIEVKCPKCKTFSHLPTSIAVGPHAYCIQEDCGALYIYFNFNFESGNRYKFRSAIYIYYGGFDGKWWIKV